MERSLGAPVTALNGKMNAFDGHLFNNQGINVNIDDALFDVQSSQISVPTITTVLNVLVQDPDVNAMGPYTNNAKP